MRKKYFLLSLILYLYEIIDLSWACCNNHFTIYINQTMLHSLNLYNDIPVNYLSIKLGKKVGWYFIPSSMAIIIKLVTSVGEDVEKYTYNPGTLLWECKWYSSLENTLMVPQIVKHIVTDISTEIKIYVHTKTCA